MNRVILATIAAVAASLLSSATPVYNTPADLTGTRTVAAGNLTASGGTAYLSGFSIKWEIEKVSGGYEYEYKLSGYSGQRTNISHFILEFSQTCLGGEKDNLLSDANCLKDPEKNEHDVNVAYGAWTATSNGNSNPGLPGTLYGVKFTTGGAAPETYTFFSDRAPVWGDFYVRGGQDNRVYNNGITDHTSANTNWFIARPDTTVSQTPEPASMALFGAGIGLIAIGRRFVRKQTR